MCLETSLLLGVAALSSCEGGFVLMTSVIAIPRPRAPLVILMLERILSRKQFGPVDGFGCRLQSVMPSFSFETVTALPEASAGVLHSFWRAAVNCFAGSGLRCVCRLQQSHADDKAEIVFRWTLLLKQDQLLASCRCVEYHPRPSKICQSAPELVSTTQCGVHCVGYL